MFFGLHARACIRSGCFQLPLLGLVAGLCIRSGASEEQLEARDRNTLGPSCISGYVFCQTQRAEEPSGTGCLSQGPL